jgi:hypothetical protein
MGSLLIVRFPPFWDQYVNLKFLTVYLFSFGYCYTVLPFTVSNNLKTKHLHLWMRGRRSIEQRQEQAWKVNNHIDTTTMVVDCPALSDVVFKTGSSNLSHPGNSAFHEMLRNQSQISPTSVGMIFETVTGRNCRFLEWDSSGYWKVISDPVVIRQKIYSSLMYAKRSSNAWRHRQNISSSTFMFERQYGRKRKRAADGAEISSCVRLCRD